MFAKTGAQRSNFALSPRHSTAYGLTHHDPRRRRKAAMNTRIQVAINQWRRRQLRARTAPYATRRSRHDKGQEGPSRNQSWFWPNRAHHSPRRGVWSSRHKCERMAPAADPASGSPSPRVHPPPVRDGTPTSL